jgi:hypothetical protein
MSKPYQGHITNWELQKFGGKLVIVGVTKAPTRSEAHFIRTSAVQVLTPSMVETLNSIYSLDEMANP